MSPGGSGTAGTLTIDGNYTQGAGGTLQIDIGGTTAGTDYDQLVVTGTAALAGAMSVGLISGYVPAAATVITPVTAGSITGQFASLPGSGIGHNLELDPVYAATTVKLSTDLAVGPEIIGSRSRRR